MELEPAKNDDKFQSAKKKLKDGSSSMDINRRKYFLLFSLFKQRNLFYNIWDNDSILHSFKKLKPILYEEVK